MQGRGVLFNDSFPLPKKIIFLSQWQTRAYKIRNGGSLIPNGQFAEYIYKAGMICNKGSWGYLNPTSYDFGGYPSELGRRGLSKKISGITP